MATGRSSYQKAMVSNGKKKKVKNAPIKRKIKKSY